MMWFSRLMVNAVFPAMFLSKLVPEELEFPPPPTPTDAISLYVTNSSQPEGQVGGSHSDISPPVSQGHFTVIICKVSLAYWG